MKASELCALIISGEVKIDLCGHRINDCQWWFKDWLEHNTAYANGKGDGTWNERDYKSVEETDAGMRDSYQRMLDHEVEHLGRMTFTGGEQYCFECGRRLQFVFNSEINTMELREYWDADAPRERGPFKTGDHVLLPHNCEFEEIKPYGGKIKVPSGILSFANFFVGLEDCDEEHEHSDEYSLNCKAGRIRRAEWKSKNQNVAYGQMGNMSIGIYAHPNRRSVIIGPSCVADCHPNSHKMSDEEWDAASKIEGHEQVGEISLSCWRWEASDKESLGDNYNKTANADRVEGPIDVDVASGDWKFEHYYDNTYYEIEGTNDDNYIYARLTLEDN